MHLEIKQREREGITLLDLNGKIVLGEEDSSLRQHLESLLARGTQKVILNLRQVTDLDSAALGTLVLIATRFRDSGGKLVLLNMASSHAKLPEILKLNTVFETYQDEVDALNSFFPERKITHYDILEFVEGKEQDRKG
jgi:anti-sigma B factor antagonist